MKYLIVGATSDIGFNIVEELTKSNPGQVRVLLRSKNKADLFSSMGCEVVDGDLSDPTTISDAFMGIEKAFILTPPSDLAPALFSNAIWAAKQANVKHVVRISAFKAAHDALTINGRYHALSDTELMASGLAYTIVKPHFFMQNLFMAAETVKNGGHIYMPLSTGKLAMIDSQDIVDFCVKVLITEGHENKTYTITGPESISMDQVAASLSKVLHKPINYHDVPIQSALDMIKEKGADTYTINVLHDYFYQYARGWGDVVTADFSQIVGRSANSIDDFFLHNKVKFTN